MRIDKRHKIEFATSKDESRPVLCEAFLDTATSELQMTDSYRLAVVPVTLDEGDVSGLVPVDAIIQARRRGKRTEAAHVECGPTSIIVPAFGRAPKLVYSRVDGTFPRVTQLLPEFDKDAKVFRVNVDLLARTAKAMGTDTVTLVLGSPLRPLGVISEDAIGLMMPVRTSEDAGTWPKRLAARKPEQRGAA